MFIEQRSFAEIMDRTDEEILKTDPDLANMFTDDEDDDCDTEDTSSSFNFASRSSSRRSQSAKLG